MSRREELAKRHALLTAECALQRGTLRAQARALGISTGVIRSGEGLFGRFKVWPVPSWAWVAAGAALLLVPGKAAKLARNALMVLQLFQGGKPSASETNSPPKV